MDMFTLFLVGFLVGFMLGAVLCKNYYEYKVEQLRAAWEREIQSHEATLESWQRSLRKTGVPV